MIRFLLLLLFFGAITKAPAQSPTRTGKDYAVFFYVTTFQPGWAALPETAKEAADLKKELEANFGFIGELVANPTRAEMRTKIREYNAKLTDNDQVLYFFSMHGYYNVRGDRGYLVGKEGTANELALLYGDSLLSYDDLRTDLAPCKAKHILLALDACHSGAFGIRNKSGPDAPAYEEEEDCATQISKTMRYTGRQYCTSGNKNAKTPAKSLFVARFLEALRKGGDGKTVHFRDLEYWLDKVESPRPESGSYYGHEPGGDFIFVRKNACGGESTKPIPTLSEAEEQTWKIAQRLKNGQIYLEEYPNGKYAREAVKLQSVDPAVQVGSGQERQMEAPKEDIFGIRMVFVNGGTFTMGSPENEADRGSDETQHAVTLSDFHIGQFEVTQKQWRQVMGKNPSRFKICHNCPVERVSWEDVQEFLKKLNEKLPSGQKPYRLPTEAEWEYAARGGGKAILFGNGKNIIDSKEINFDGSAAYKTAYSVAGKYRQKTVPVGNLNSPNALGLHDMSDNVWEWCSDWYGAYPAGSQTNPTGPATGSDRVRRGGSWNYYPQKCRVAGRGSASLYTSYDNIGFRLARTK